MSGIMDYGAIMRSGAALVPDYQQQQMQQQEMALRKQQLGQQQQRLQLQTQQAQREAEQQQRYQQRFAEVASNPTAEGIFQLMGEYPDMSEGLKRGWDAMDASRKNADGRQMLAVATRIKNGDVKGALAEVERRIAADGDDDPSDRLIRDMLASDDPQAHKMALTMVGAALAQSGENGRAVVEQLFPKAEIVDDRLIVRDDGLGGKQIVGQLPGYNKAVPEGGAIVPFTTPGVPVINADGSTTMPVAPSGQSAAPATAPAPSGTGKITFNAPSWAKVTSATRTPERNRQVGGTPNSWHLTGQARDYVPSGGQTVAQLAAELRRMNPGMEVINEGDHVHVEPPGSPGKARMAGPIRVRSKQQYNRLPSGTQYIAPDGSVRTKT